MGSSFRWLAIQECSMLEKTSGFGELVRLDAFKPKLFI
jgi:hypothetical protein